jgi:hypothetical protein
MCEAKEAEKTLVALLMVGAVCIVWNVVWVFYLFNYMSVFF